MTMGYLLTDKATSNIVGWRSSFSDSDADTVNQEEVSDTDPRVEALMNPPEMPDPYEELLDALDEVAANLQAGERVKLDALLAK
jgi:hypothetical protein